jgi:hypothetical protein
MSRSSYFGLAATIALDQFPGRDAVNRTDTPVLARSKVHKTGGLRTRKSSSR